MRRFTATKKNMFVNLVIIMGIFLMTIMTLKRNLLRSNNFTVVLIFYNLILIIKRFFTNNDIKEKSMTNYLLYILTILTFVFFLITAIWCEGKFMNIDKNKTYVYFLTAFVIIAILLAEFHFSKNIGDMRFYFYIFSLCMTIWIIAIPRKFDKVVIFMYFLQLILGLNIILK